MQHFPGIALLEIFEHQHRLWFCGLDNCDSEETLCIFLAPGLLLREDTEDGSTLFDPR